MTQHTEENADTDIPEDPMAELKAMQQVAEALSPLTPVSVNRVLNWALDFYGVGYGSSRTQASGIRTAGQGGSTPSVDSVGARMDLTAINSLDGLYDLANPSSDAEKALVVGYWLHEYEEMEDFDSQKVNTELKHLGYGIGNITRALEQLKARKPTLVMQTRKTGSSQQARKRYKITNAGKKEVERMVGQESLS